MKAESHYINKEIRREIFNQITLSGTATPKLKKELNEIDFVKSYKIPNGTNGSQWALGLLGQGWSL